MLMTEQAPSVMAAAAVCAETIDSSRHTGVEICRASSAWPEHVLLLERLLDEEQVEGVELGEVPGVAEGVRRVRVDLQKHVVPEPLPHGAHRLDVPARLDLQLDPDVARVQVAVDDVEQLRDAVEDADRDTRGHPVVDGAELPRPGAALGPQLGVEHRHLEGGLRHPVALELVEHRTHRVRAVPVQPVGGAASSGSR